LAETGLTANMFFKSDAMLRSILSSSPCRLAMKGYVARRSMDKTYGSNTIENFTQGAPLQFPQKKNQSIFSLILNIYL
jgi:hypothetical protein